MPSRYLAVLCLGPAMSFRRVTRLAAFLPLLAGSTLVSPAAAAEAGSLTGTVSNIATGNLLQGAKVEVPATGADHAHR